MFIFPTTMKTTTNLECCMTANITESCFTFFEFIFFRWLAIVADSHHLQSRYDEVNIRQTANLDQLHREQRHEDELIIRIADNQQQINDCNLQIYRSTEENKLRQVELENNREQQAKYGYRNESIQTTTYNHRREQPKFNYN